MSKKAAKTTPIQPGQYVREQILGPKKMSVTEAAKILGIGRPALSNFLNGNAALSPDMAARIERAFSIPAQKLLDVQAAYDAAQAKTKGAPANTKAYVPPFLEIKANEIVDWVDSNIGARTRLSVFLRMLVNSTGVGLTKVDFPGNDDAERHGWDGFTAASEGTPWVPEGQAGWEFGCNQDPKSKADNDYANRTKTTEKSERDNTVFVFVTPRRWHGKEKWKSDRKADGQWKDVLVYDASDLEQWLEQSVAGQAWFADETQRASRKVRSLDKCWSDWANVSDPSLSAALFNTAVESAKKTMASRLAKTPEEPTIIAADSTEEALAFLAVLFSEAGEDLAIFRDRVVVFDQPGILPKLAAGSSNFIAVATTREVERELAPFCRSLHTIVVHPRNATNTDPHILLEPLNYEAFRSALETMGYDRNMASRLDDESGRSLTVLRRRLSKVDAIRIPEWAADHKTAVLLVPFMFAGAWNSNNAGDQAILSLLAGETPYPDIEKNLQALTRLNDAAVWSTGLVRGVVSKIDLLFAISGVITRPDLEIYFEVAHLVLSEDDPKLDLPEKERMFAGIHGKTREISGALRSGISETLVLLAVHGNTLFKDRLGIDVEAKAIRLIRDLLKPLTTRKLEAHERDLPTYAEAAPNEFLKILEEDLRTPEPASIGLMRPAESGMFGSGCGRAGLLWALEGLAWSPETLSRTVLVLARLSEVKLEDNWMNKPIASLRSIFRSWMPQTAANLEQRIAAMQLLAERFPKIAWEVCIDQFGDSHRMGHYSHKPRWRTDAHGYGEPVTRGEMQSFELKMIDMALNWKQHDRSMVGSLIERLHDLDETQQVAVWDLVKRWAEAGASDSDKAWIREKIRVTVMSRRGVARTERRRASNLNANAKAAYKALEPTDLLNKHEWIFREVWVDESADELQEEEIDFRKRDERIKNLRIDALREIYTERDVEGIFALAEMGKSANQIGWLMASYILPAGKIADFIVMAMKPGTNADPWPRRNLIYGALRALEDDARTRVLKRVKKAVDEDFVKTLVLAPFRKSTWSLVDDLNVNHKKSYWDEISPGWEQQVDEEINEAIERLLLVKRPIAAFNFIHFTLEKLRPALLFRLMTEMAATQEEKFAQPQLREYDIARAFELLDKSGEFSVDQMAGLEFPYLDILARRWGSREERGIPNLEKYLEKHPEFFAQAVAWVYKRNGGGEDPADMKLDDPEQVKRRAELGYKLIGGLKSIPGRNKQGEIDTQQLLGWVNTVRQSCAELDRQDVGDLSLGELFSNAPEGSDGVWPCEPVRQVLEKIQSESISDGITTGLYNSRGAVWRGEGGDQERELEAKYRNWARALEFSHPFVASTILKHMADTYAYEAEREDTEAGVRRRLR